MATDELLQLLQQQIQQQQLMMQAQEKRHQEQIQVLLTLAQKSEGEGTVNSFTAALPSFSAGQQTPPKYVNQLDIKEISEFMIEQFHPKRFIVRERYKFWSHMDRKPGETIQELVVNSRPIGRGFAH